MRKLSLGVFILLLTSLAFAQDHNRFDFATTAGGVFSKTTSSSSGNVRDKPTKSVAYTGTFRYHFAPKHAIEINIGHTSNSQIFLVSSESFRVVTGITEYTGDYVFTPFSRGRLHPFLLAGAGALRFNPGNTYIDTFPASFGAARQTSLAFAYGAGVDYHVWRIVAFRLQYRGLIYKQPDFQVPTLFFTGAKGHMAEPAAGIAVRF